MKTAALLGRNNEVIGEVFDAPQTGHTIKVAGDFDINGDPVNVKTYKISRSIKNVAVADFAQPVVKIGNVYTFHAVEDDEVQY